MRRITSSARTIRRALCGSIFSAAPGVRRAAPRTRPPRRPAPPSLPELGPQIRVLAREARSHRRPLARRGPCRPRGRALAARSIPATRRARLLVTHRRPLFGGLGHVDHVVRHPRPFGDGRLGGPDVEPAVHLHGVERDDLDVTERAGGTESERRLPRCGRSDKSEVRERGYTTATGMRVGCAAARLDDAHDVTAQPVRRSVDDTHVDERARLAGSVGRAKCTSLFWRVRPDSTDGSFFDGPSTSTSSTRPAPGAVGGVPLHHLDQPPMRSWATSGGTKASTSRRRAFPVGARTRTCRRRRTPPRRRPRASGGSRRRSRPGSRR